MSISLGLEFFLGLAFGLIIGFGSVVVINLFCLIAKKEPMVLELPIIDKGNQKRLDELHKKIDLLLSRSKPPRAKTLPKPALESSFDDIPTRRM